MEIAIPGFSSSSGIDTQELIKKLVEVESRPLYNLQDRIQNSQNEVKIWQSLDRDMNQFEESAKKMYGFNNPFDERLVKNSDETVLTASAVRNAAAGEYEVVVKQTASADVWASDPINKNTPIPSGKYTFLVGDEEISFSFAGGSIGKFFTVFNENTNKDVLVMKTLRRGVSKDETTVILESKKRGKEAALVLKDKSTDLSKIIGLQKFDAGHNEKKIVFTENNIAQVLSDENTILIEDNHLQLKSGGIIRVGINEKIPPEITNSHTAVMELTFLPKAPSSSNTTNSDAISAASSIADALKTTLEDASVMGVIPQAQSSHDNINSDLGIVFSSDKKKVIRSVKKEAASGPITISVPISNIKDKDSLVSFIMANPFPNYDLVLEGLKFQSNYSNRNLVPKNPISQARNAIIRFNDVDIERETNVFDDIIPGVTLTAKRAANKNIILTVGYNTKVIKDYIINFIGSYNHMMKMVTVYTIPPPPGSDSSFSSNNNSLAILDELNFASEQERDNAEKNAGKLNGNLALIRFMNTLVRAMGNQYPNSVDENITTLRSIGIASNISGNSSSRLSVRFLDIDEGLLDSMLNENMEAVSNLFGSSAANTGVIEDGVAFNSVEIINPFVITSGIISQRKSVLQGSIRKNEQEANRHREKIEKYEAKLKRDYAAMDQALHNLEDASQSLEGFTNRPNSR